MDIGAQYYRRFLEGDEQALSQLVTEYSDGLILFINGFVKDINTAEDLSDETFAKLIYKKCNFKGNSSFKTYLYKIGRNLALNYIKKRSKISDKSIEEFQLKTPEHLSLERHVLKNEQNEHLHSAINQLVPQYKEIIYLLYFEDMSYEEAAFVLKKNEKQIKNLAYRSRQALKIILDEEGFVYEKL